MRTPEIRPGVRRQLRVPGKRDPQREADDEIRLHLELRTRQLIDEGMTPDEARAEAERRFGEVDDQRALLIESNARHARAARLREWLEGLRQDFRFAVRTLRRDIGFTAFAVPTIALGIAASVTVFSLVNGLLLRPLPFRDAKRLAWISNISDDGASEWTFQAFHYLDVQARNKSFDEIAAYYAYYSIGGSILSDGSDVQRFTTVGVTCNFLPFLGVRPMLGRSFTPEECRWGAPNTVLLTEDFWRRRFSANKAVVGRTITLNNAPATIIGVLPRTFDFPSIFAPGTPAEFFKPFPVGPETNKSGNTLAVIGRLKPGVSPEQANAELSSLGKQLTAEFPDRNTLRPKVVALEARINGPFRPALWTLAGAVVVVMLIVCANLSSLQYARSLSRQRELAVRLALGAARSRLVRQAFTESILIAGAGAAIGLAVALVATRVVSRLSAFKLPLLARVAVDGWALALAVGLCFVVGIAIGVLPALRAPSDATDTLKEGQRSLSGDRRQGRARASLVVAEMAAACMLLVGAGLLIRSFQNVVNQELGYRPAHLATVRVDPPTRLATITESRLYYDEVLRRTRAVPGVADAAIADLLPFGGDRSWSVHAEGQVYRRGEMPEAFMRVVSGGYFKTMGIPMVAGRDFNDGDANWTATAPPVAAVNETLARTLWPGRSPIGQLIFNGNVSWRVIAVVGDVRHGQLERPFTNEMYISIRQSGFSAANLVVRTTLPLGEISSAVRASLLPFAPNLPKNQWRSLQELVDAVASPRRFVMLLVGGFAAFALLLASLGIYALVSYSVSQRTREIGIRIALGASAGRVRSSVMSQTVRLAASGVALGIVAAFLLSRVLRGVLFGVEATDPASYAGALVVLALVALAAGYLPARRASRVDPNIALRDG